MQKRANGGSRQSIQNAPTRGAMVDPQTYGMLLWQSKLQDKFLKEQKESRQKDERIQETQQIQESEQKQVQRSSQPEIPQMIPGPAPYTVTTIAAPSTQIPIIPQQSTNGEKIANGPMTVVDQPLFPNISTRIRTSVSSDTLGKTVPMLGNIVSYQQMGGSGSPRRTPSGKVLTIVRGDPEIRYHQKDTRGFDQTIRYLMDREKVLEYKRELDRQLEERNKWRSQLGSAAIKGITRKGSENGGNNTSKAHTFASDHPSSTHSERVFGIGANKNGTELAPLMRKFNSLPKLNTRSSTDVTRPYVHSPRNEFFHPIQPNEVAESLSCQLREKEWLNRRQQESERVATERHFQTWDSLWGRPGAGAPNPYSERSIGHAVSFGNLYGGPHTHQRGGYNKVNLFKALHMTHQHQPRPK